MGSARASIRAGLTPREDAVLQLVLAGASNPVIAVKLRCSVKTIEFHVGNILRKTGEKNRVGLIVRVLGRDARASRS